MDKSVERLYLECISSLAETIGALRKVHGRSAVAREMELECEYHLRQYERIIREAAL